MKIIAGKYKGRNIITPEEFSSKPTKGIMREALFNILNANFIKEDGSPIIQDCLFLDLCCGTGSIGFEALSRGAGKSIFIDTDKAVLETIRATAKIFGISDNCLPLRLDATKLPVAKEQCNVVFIDPPYKVNLISPMLISLYQQEWIASNSVVIFESSIFDEVEIPQYYEVIKERRYGKVKLTLLNMIN